MAAGDQGTYVVVLDVESGTIHPVLEPVFIAEMGRHHILRVARGAFVRAVPGEGECLNLRRAPDLAAELGGCAAHGVLLGLLEDDDALSDWRHVRHPNGTEGYVSAEFVE
jgi:hypothetical protein